VTASTSALEADATVEADEDGPPMGAITTNRATALAIMNALERLRFFIGSSPYFPFFLFQA